MIVEPAWLQVARRYDGLQEIPGPESNPVILEMARAIGAPAWYHNDDQPWCAVGQNYFLLESGLPMAVGDRGDLFDRLRALTFSIYGQGIVRPALGAIGVFSRPGEGAHVGMYLGQFKDLLYIYGANQSNKVGATWIREKRLKCWRWPPGVPLPQLGPILLTGNGDAISVNEA